MVFRADKVAILSIDHMSVSSYEPSLLTLDQIKYCTIEISSDYDNEKNEIK